MTIPVHEQFPHGSIICLETADEEYYSYSLSEWINATIESQDPDAIEAIRTLWDGEEWDDIVSKAQVEESVWYVWWMDGVRAYAQKDQESIDPDR